jgi:hypothetical protein
LTPKEIIFPEKFPIFCQKTEKLKQLTIYFGCDKH